MATPIPPMTQDVSDRLDPALAREFMAQPLGAHSPGLQDLLVRMRQPGRGPDWMIVAVEPYRRYVLAERLAEGAPRLLLEQTYPSIEACERAAFRARWIAAGGDAADVADGLGEAGGGAIVGPGVMGYPDRISVHPGERMRFHVSVEGGGAYRASLVRLVCGDTGPDGPGLEEEVVPCALDEVQAGEVQAGEMQAGVEQATEAGSCVIVEGAAAFDRCEALALEILVWPTRPGGRVQALASRWREDRGAGWLLGLDAEGVPFLVVGDGTRQARVGLATPLLGRVWYRVTGRWDGAGLSLAATPLPGQGQLLALAERATAAGGVRPAAAGPIVFAAMGIGAERPRFGGHFEGRLEAPRLRGDGVEARWDFGMSAGSVAVADRGALGLHGVAFNAPKRAVPGSAWTGRHHDFRAAPEEYAAIHFHSDDLYDCGWAASLALSLPSDLRSGFYALKLEREGPAFYAGFVVSPRPGAGRAAVAVLASTVTYMAYSNYRTRLRPGPTELASGCMSIVDLVDIYLMEHPELGSSQYDKHPDGTGVTHVSERRPLFNFRPTGRYWNMAIDIGLIHWLESGSVEYEVISDHDVHAYGAEALAGYRVVLTGCHPEYDSWRMLDAFEAFLGGGGRFMYLGGNGFYWHVSFDPLQPGLMEVRRAEDGTRAWVEEPGHYYHQGTGEYGGLWRRLGRPPNRLAGIGFIAQGFDRAAGYRLTAGSRDARVGFMVAGVEGPVVGDHGAWGGGAAGMEVDCVMPELGAPPHVLVVARSERLTQAYLLVNEEISSNRQGVDGSTSALVRADMVFFETPAGGAVFSVGSIAYIGGLWKTGSGYDNDLSRLTLNVVRRFAEAARFALPDGVSSGGG